MNLHINWKFRFRIIGLQEETIDVVSVLKV